jgi:hypothetical protein
MGRELEVPDDVDPTQQSLQQHEYVMTALANARRCRYLSKAVISKTVAKEVAHQKDAEAGGSCRVAEGSESGQYQGGQVEEEADEGERVEDKARKEKREEKEEDNVADVKART